MKTLTARLLRPFTKVHPEEAATVVLMTACAFALLTAYYLLKTVREPLILLQGGPEVKLYARAGQILLMIGVVHLYGQLARRVGRIKLLGIVFLFFISNLAVFAVLAGTSLSIGLPFFLWVGVFSYTVVAQFWALAADIYSEEQGKRLFPIIGAGSSIGAVVGGLFAKSLVPFGPQVLMGTAVVILLACVGAIVVIERRSARVAARPQADKHPDEPLSNESAWHLLARDRYLLVIAGLVVFLNWVNSSGEYLLDRILVATAHDVASQGGNAQTYIGTFKADYYFWYNSIGVALQLFVVSRVFKLVGVRGALFVMPVFALIAYAGAVALPVIAVMRLVKIGENSLQYSLQDTTRNALYLVTSRVEKFVGKTAVDTVGVRSGAIMSTIMVFIGTRLGWSTSTFAMINVGLVVAWLAFVLLVRREHRRRSALEPAALEGEPRPRPTRGTPTDAGLAALPAR
ncbi:MAG TPA: Npt1/Npt2 family nucleotide transporter [Kofleriaceae bacterium]|nr:Npt1/Npt2 family nucleotide transporter [Kofleriaceae bacterium]